ncbi:fimbria/pilus outer membrane usher protein [Pseudomonas sp. KCJK9016]|uniref:fimbria/pilus outer membrane usher protein n=1 Tax=Pseudomonas sp. KCJK9016 TaxID=3344556 RepID=UPI0039066F82
MYLFIAHNRVRVLFLSLLLMLCSASMRLVWAAEEYEFDSSFLKGGGSALELHRFSSGNYIEPGKYQVDVVVNQTAVGREEVEFYADQERSSAKPCLRAELLDRAGLDLLKIPGLDIKDRKACIDLVGKVESSSVRYEDGDQRLLLSVPQTFLRRSVQGYVDPSQWNSGVDAGMLSYNYGSFYSSTQKAGLQNYLGLTAGLNIAGWRLRSESNLDWNGSTRRWQNRNSYIQREVQKLESQLTLGDFSTNGSLFDSFSMRGVQIASDERMLPDSLSGYAPVVRGQANSNAKVKITQNGYVVYETTVAPGPFEINDLYPSGYGGDLEVSVTEADGQERKFRVPYASVVRMLRPGAQRYSAALGQYRNGFDSSSKRLVGQLTYERGLNNTFTGYTGILAAEGYTAPLVGIAMNTGLGAFGLDVTHAQTQVDPEGKKGRSNGESARISFSKTLPETGSSVSIAAYRYSTSGFYNLADAMQVLDNKNEKYKYRYNEFDIIDSDLSTRFFEQPERYSEYKPSRQRSTFQTTLSQALGDNGSIYFNGILSDYWNQKGQSVQYQIGYSGSTRYFNYSISAMRSTDQFGEHDDQMAVTFNIPLGGRTSASSSVTLNKRGTGLQGGINGSGGNNNEYDWGVSSSKNEQEQKSISTYGNYRGGMGTLNASIGSGTGYNQASLGVSGSVVLHPGGVTFGQQVSETFGVIEAPAAVGASITSQPGVKVDERGYAVVPYLTPYRRNTLDIDPSKIPDDVEFTSTTRSVVPTAGAVVTAKFETVKGRALVIDLQFSTGASVPFGTEVLSSEGAVVGVVGQGGRLMVRGLKDTGVLLVKWGESQAQQCRVTYALAPDQTKVHASRFERISAPCIPMGSQEQVVAQRVR